MRRRGIMAGVTTILGERIEELRTDRQHGGSWMARRAVEALAEVAEQPAASGEELLASLVSAGRELAESRPGSRRGSRRHRTRPRGGRMPHLQLEVDQLQQLVREEADSLVDGRRRAAASIAIQLRERLENAVVLTHSASATVREALLLTPPERVICTVSSPQDEGRSVLGGATRGGAARSSSSRTTRRRRSSNGPRPARRRGHGVPLRRRSRTRPARRRWQRPPPPGDVPTVVACEVIKLAPMDAADADLERRDLRPDAARS